ncbi:MAG: RNA polymerase sigma factor, partial [Gemmatimonadaceae bacterium]
MRNRTRAEYRAMNDGELIIAIRLREPLAFEEFFLRFEPLLLDTARNAGIPAAEREQQVQDLLADVGMALANRDLEIPRQLRSYLMRSLRNRWRNSARAATRRARHEYGAAVVAERAVIDENSEPTEAQPSEAGDEGQAEFSEPVRRLALALRRELTDAERQLLVWANRGVPTRLIAEWLGDNRSAVKVRIWRLRQRLWRMAQEFGIGLSDAQRTELDR